MNVWSINYGPEECEIACDHEGAPRCDEVAQYEVDVATKAEGLEGMIRTLYLCTYCKENYVDTAQFFTNNKD